MQDEALDARQLLSVHQVPDIGVIYSIQRPIRKDQNVVYCK